MVLLAVLRDDTPHVGHLLLQDGHRGGLGVLCRRRVLARWTSADRRLARLVLHRLELRAGVRHGLMQGLVLRLVLRLHERRHLPHFGLHARLQPAVRAQMLRAAGGV